MNPSHEMIAKQASLLKPQLLYRLPCTVIPFSPDKNVRGATGVLFIGIKYAVSKCYARLR
jgi:hypothetical protein